MYDDAARACAEWMARHHGVITRDRAGSLGLSSKRVDGLLRRGEWQLLQRGVMGRAGSPPSPHRTLLAAVAAGGAGSMASHLSAAWLRRLLDRPPSPVWVTLPHPRRRRIAGAVVHRTRLALPDDPTDAIAAAGRVEGIPCTSIEQTLVDCAATANASTLAGIVDRALALRAVDVTELVSYLGRGPGWRPGAGALREQLVGRGYSGAPAASVLESAFDRLVARAEVPEPMAEHCVPLDGHLRFLDRAFPDLMLAWEVDGHAYHSSPEQVALDHHRRNGFTVRGWTVLVFTWVDVMHHPEEVVAQLEASYVAAKVRREQGMAALH